MLSPLNHRACVSTDSSMPARPCACMLLQEFAAVMMSSSCCRAAMQQLSDQGRQAFCPCCQATPSGCPFCKPLRSLLCSCSSQLPTCQLPGQPQG